MRKSCQDCGTRLELNGVCPNCDEAAFIMDWQDPGPVSEQFEKEAAEGYERARRRHE